MVIDGNSLQDLTGEPQAVAVSKSVVDGRSPGLFVENMDSSAGPRWAVWKGDFELLMKANKIGGADRADWLKVHAGPDIQRLDRHLPAYEGEDKEKLDEYDKLIKRLDAYFLPKTHFVVERAKFREMEPRPGEKIDSFIVRLREQGAKTDFDEKLEINIIDQIVATCKDENLKDKITKKDYPLEKIQKIAAAFQSKIGQKNKEINAIDPKTRDNRAEDFRTCFNCGRSGHISTDQICPARGKRCRKCNGTGHFESKCRSRKRPAQDSRDFSSSKRRREVNEARDLKEEQMRENKNIYHLFPVGEAKADLNCFLGGIPFKVLIDSGADLNIIGLSQWQFLKDKKFQIWNSRAGSNGKMIRGYGATKSLTIKGSFETRVSVGDKEVSALFYVVENGNRALLSRETSLNLGVLKLGADIGQVTAELNKIKG